MKERVLQNNSVNDLQVKDNGYDYIQERIIKIGKFVFPKNCKIKMIIII